MTFGLALRAGLVFREQRQIYDYWLSCAHMRPMPSRGDIDPCSMRNHLPQISLIDISDGLKGATFRLAGSKLRDVYGLEVTGKRLSDLEWGEKREYWQDIYQNVVDKRCPQMGSVSGPLQRREHVKLYWLRLPLSDDGVRVNKILCHDIVVPHAPAVLPGGDVSAESFAVAI